MATDPYLAAQIQTIDAFFCKDLWALLARAHPDVEQAEPAMIDVVNPEVENRKRG